MKTIIVYKETDPSVPIKVKADLFPNLIRIYHDFDVAPNCTYTELDFPVEGVLWGDVLCATYNAESGVLNPLPRKQFYATPLPLLNDIIKRGLSELERNREILSSIRNEGDIGKIYKILKRSFHVFRVNTTVNNAKAHKVDVQLNGRSYTALVDTGAEISVADPNIFAKSTLPRSHIRIDGVKGGGSVPCITVPRVSFTLKGKTYEMQDLDFALTKTHYPVLLSVEVDNHINAAEGITTWN